MLHSSQESRVSNSSHTLDDWNLGTFTQLIFKVNMEKNGRYFQFAIAV